MIDWYYVNAKVRQKHKVLNKYDLLGSFYRFSNVLHEFNIFNVLTLKLHIYDKLQIK